MIAHDIASGEFPVQPLFVPNGQGLYERCAPQMFGVFAIAQSPVSGELPVFKLLAVDTTAIAARAMATTRV